MKHHFRIFCDGGFGNRLNTLISGLALAEELQMPATIYWPRNNWCQAGFAQIFANTLDISEKTLTDLAGTLNDSLILLHDTLGADTLRVPFHSAYDYASLESFKEQTDSNDRDIFFYPALIPQWLPMHLVVRALQGCRFQAHICEVVSTFVAQTLGKPFHGLHLRRTDLNVGYSDEEVQAIVRMYPQESFFVCSDDPIAEALAAVHPNVYRRDKSAYVGKRDDQGDWMALTADDDGRMYHSNIDRNADSVVDAVTDMLILAHSSIVGYSGSTFQNMARLFGQHAPMVAMAKPAQAIEFLALSSAVRMIRAGSLALSACVGQGIELFNQGHRSAAIALEKAAIEHAEAKALRGVNLFLLHYNVAAHLLSDGHPYEASLYAEKALALMPASNEAVTLLNMTRAARGPTALHQ